MTADYLSESVDEDRVVRKQRFSQRSSHAEQNKIMRTTLMRLAEVAADVNLVALPIGQVVQVFSLFCNVQHETTTYLAVVRKTLSKTSDSAVVVGDRVRFRTVTVGDTAAGQPEAVIEQIEDRQTILTRSDSFKAVVQHPIVANADQMLIVTSLCEPTPRWSLIDRMIVAAQSGKLLPIICLNKMDLTGGQTGDALVRDAEAVLAHYAKLGFLTLRTSTVHKLGLLELQQTLAGKVTVLAGHSGVGKSSLINAIEPTLNLRTAAISGYTGKGRHTTTSARYYPLNFPGGGSVIDTPGVKVFGLWGVRAGNLAEFFPDIADGSAPDWRKDSYERIVKTLPAS